MSFGHEDPDLKLVHEHMKGYLKVEEEAMERRIRYYLHSIYSKCHQVSIYTGQFQCNAPDIELQIVGMVTLAHAYL